MSIVRDFLNTETCQRWVAALDRQQGEATGILRDGVDTPSDTRVTERVIEERVESEATRVLRHLFTTLLPRSTGREIEWFESPQILRYHPGGHYELHADSERYVKDHRAWQRVMDRDVSLLLYLNEDFEGGALSFYAFNYVYQPRRGDLLYFPSDHRFAHQAHKVTAGRRYAVVSWAVFRGSRRIGTPPPGNAVFLGQDRPPPTGNP
ncbi:MAG: 2OG-Fe(II) oxygenase [Xanthomonadales bacterium]|nr:2OG-Fe(II) oxygenase [Xanthomonadales bacterium]